jgi:hypothetical protein
LRKSDLSDAVKALPALTAAFSIQGQFDAFGSPCGLPLSTAFQVASQAAEAASQLAAGEATDVVNRTQRQACVRAILRVLLAVLPLHIRPGDSEVKRYLLNLSNVSAVFLLEKGLQRDVPP